MIYETRFKILVLRTLLYLMEKVPNPTDGAEVYSDCHTLMRDLEDHIEGK